MKDREKCPKAALVTWCYKGEANYGQVLQCYAMQRVIQHLGFDVIVIQYRKPEEKERLSWWWKAKSFIGLYELWYRLTKVEQRADIRIMRFVQFIRKNICLSKQCYTKEQVEKECENCSVLFCGSDQIWNPLRYDDIYLLHFGTLSQKRIAYAPSGVFVENTSTEFVYKKIGQCLDSFDLITIREKESIDILSKYTRKKIVDVVDPTLLISKKEWNQIARKQLSKEPYIFCYFLGRFRAYKMLLKKIMREYRVSKVLFVTSGFYKEENELNADVYFRSVKGAGPSEFLALIRDAQAVCTDSFHGIAFSIIYQKQFYMLGRNIPQKDFWASTWRQHNLLEKTGIQGQQTINCLKDLELWKKIDYSDVHLELLWREAEQILSPALADCFAVN